jgi:hypothetical protein
VLLKVPKLRRLGGRWIQHSQGRSRERPKLTWELYYSGSRRVTRSMEGIELAGKTVQWSHLEDTILRTKGHFWPASKEEFCTWGYYYYDDDGITTTTTTTTWRDTKYVAMDRKESWSRCCTSFCILYAWTRLGQSMVMARADLFSYRRRQLLELLGVPKKNFQRLQFTAGVTSRLSAVLNLPS